MEETFGVIGSGSWATALTKSLSDKGYHVNWYIRDQKNIEYISEKRHHCKYLQAAKLNVESITMSSDINTVVKVSTLLIFAVPSTYLLSELGELHESLEDKKIVSAVKGFVGEHNCTIAEYFQNHYHISKEKLAVISGPCHAEEVAMQRLTYMTLSSYNTVFSSFLCEVFKTDFINPISSNDVFGLEYAAALKNVYAIAVGIAHGLGYGDNFIAVLVTGSYNEMTKFIETLNPDSERITSKSAYLGDLMVTCYSQFSRNRTFGTMIGQGYGVVSAQMEMMMVAEGYYSCKALYYISQKYNLNLPIVSAVYQILYDQAPLNETFSQLTKTLE